RKRLDYLIYLLASYFFCIFHDQEDTNNIINQRMFLPRKLGSYHCCCMFRDRMFQERNEKINCKQIFLFQFIIINNHIRFNVVLDSWFHVSEKSLLLNKTLKSKNLIEYSSSDKNHTKSMLDCVTTVFEDSEHNFKIAQLIKSSFFMETNLYLKNQVNVDSFEVEPPVECYKLRIIGVYCLILFIFGIVANSVLLWILIHFKELRNSMNAFILALTICNFLGSMVQMPMVIVSNFCCRWIFGRNGCIFAGFVMYAIGCTSLFLLTAISFERFYIIYKPLSIKKLDYRFSITIIAICALCGILWAALPIFGWSHYSLEGALTSCSVEWNE
ncbi:melanopsin, partial [Brachionus plicatilis]